MAVKDPFEIKFSSPKPKKDNEEPVQPKSNPKILFWIAGIICLVAVLILAIDGPVQDSGSESSQTVETVIQEN